MREAKIDIVYTWCDGADSSFERQRNALCQKFGIPVQSNNDQLDVSKRYKQHNELLYSLRSVEKYALWINHIFIITNNQCPKWLKKSSKIIIVDQNDIIPKEMQPVFSSVAVEQYITEIPNLSEHFLYFCDDMFLNRKVKPSDFFRDGKPVVWKYDCSYFDFKKGDWEQTVYNAYSAFLEKNKIYYPFFSPHHGIDAYSKSMLKEILCKYPETYKRNATPFRSKDNVQRILWTYEMAYKYSCPLKTDCSCIKSKILKALFLILRRNVFFNIIYSPQSSFYRFKFQLFAKNCYSFCINNLSDEKEDIVNKYLEMRFPMKSEFEK